MKYHINQNGEVKICKAHVRPCPLGGVDGTENHFDDYFEAQRAADAINEKKFGIIKEEVTRVHTGDFLTDINRGLELYSKDKIYDDNGELEAYAISIHKVEALMKTAHTSGLVKHDTWNKMKQIYNNSDSSTMFAYIDGSRVRLQSARNPEHKVILDFQEADATFADFIDSPQAEARDFIGSAIDNPDYALEYYRKHRYLADSFADFNDEIYYVNDKIEAISSTDPREVAEKIVEIKFITATPQEMVEELALHKNAFKNKDSDLIYKVAAIFAQSNGTANRRWKSIDS